VQPMAHLLGMAAELPRDRRHAQPVPAQHDDPGPLGPVRRGMPGDRGAADLASPSSCGRRARMNFGMERASTPVLRCYPYPQINYSKRNVALGSRIFAHSGVT
jgi:hypothetical protein